MREFLHFCFALIGILVGAVMLFLSAYGLATILSNGMAFTIRPNTSEAVAGWVQAVGSILAILGAFFVGKHQADAARRLAEETDDQRIKRKIAGMRIVIDTLLHTALTSVDAIKEGEDVEMFDNIWHALTLIECEGALRAYEALPIHEFGSMKRIFVALDIENFTRKLIHDVSSVLRTTGNRQIAFTAFRQTRVSGYENSIEKLQEKLARSWPADYLPWAKFNGPGRI